MRTTRAERLLTHSCPTRLDRKLRQEETYRRLITLVTASVEGCGHLSPRRFDGKAALRLLKDLDRLRKSSDDRYVAMINRGTATARETGIPAIASAVACMIRNRKPAPL